MTVDEIKQTILIQDVLDGYGFTSNKKGYLSCPFHNEKTASFKVYSATNSFYCFGCGANGDVIKLVQMVENLDFQEAFERLGGDVPLSYKVKRELAQKRREQRAEARAHMAHEKHYWTVLDEWIRLDKNYREYYPKNAEGELHPLFVESIKKLPYQNYLINCLSEVW